MPISVSPIRLATGPIAGLLVLAAIVYAIYLLYLGLGQLMRVPADKSVGYTAVVVVAWLIIYGLLTFVIMGMLMAIIIGGAGLAGAARPY